MEGRCRLDDVGRLHSGMHRLYIYACYRLTYTTCSATSLLLTAIPTIRNRGVVLSTIIIQGAMDIFTKILLSRTTADLSHKRDQTMHCLKSGYSASCRLLLGNRTPTFLPAPWAKPHPNGSPVCLSICQCNMKRVPQVRNGRTKRTLICWDLHCIIMEGTRREQDTIGLR